MKRACVVLLALAVLAGCAPAAPAPTPEPTPETTPEAEFYFTRENFPVLDGSTSMVPLAEAAAAVLLGEDDASDLISFNRTSQSFRNLANGNCDALVVAEPAENVFTELSDMGFEYDMAKILNDALIFVVSEDNPVDSLTAGQVRGIYSGEITNWSEVGGDDVEIVPFQRNAEAGSQAAMLRVVMDGTPMMEPPEDYVIDSMGGLMESVRNFDGSAGAIGYSVYYYANDMRMAEGLKIISVDGVAPSDECIAAGEYPLLVPGYAVGAHSEPAGSPARIFWDWLQSEEGQYLIAEMGYVPAAG